LTSQAISSVNDQDRGELFEGDVGAHLVLAELRHRLEAHRVVDAEHGVVGAGVPRRDVVELRPFVHKV
jgi:hypothetical protein